MDLLRPWFLLNTVFILKPVSFLFRINPKRIGLRLFGVVISKSFAYILDIAESQWYCFKMAWILIFPI